MFYFLGFKYSGLYLFEKLVKKFLEARVRLYEGGKHVTNLQIRNALVNYTNTNLIKNHIKNYIVVSSKFSRSKKFWQKCPNYIGPKGFKLIKVGWKCHVRSFEVKYKEIIKN